MSKLHIQWVDNAEPVSIQDIDVGTYFTGRLDSESGLFCRAFEKVIRLSKPHRVWDVPEETHPDDCLKVEDYEEVDLEITISEKR